MTREPKARESASQDAPQAARDKLIPPKTDERKPSGLLRRDADEVAHCFYLGMRNDASVGCLEPKSGRRSAVEIESARRFARVAQPDAGQNRRRFGQRH